jgi:cell wall assembly regulator SMI1
VEELWRRIEHALAKQAPGLTLSPGASEADVVRTEQALGLQLPDDYRGSVRIHDGTRHYLIERWQLGSLAEVTEWRRMFDAMVDDGTLSLGDLARVRTEGPVRPQRWNRRWIPIATNTSANHLLIDLDPPEAGTPGQLVRLTREANDVAVVASSFRELLVRFADDLDHDRYEAVLEGGVTVEWHPRS